MVRYHFAAALALVVTVLATPLPQRASGSSINENAAGAQNVGKGNGQQFITGQCLSDADCASGCCATLNGGGVCSARAVATANGKQGCGFGGTGNNAAPAANSGSSSSGTTGSASTSGSTINENASGAQNVGKGDGSQFITGQCFSDADCASGCCATKNGAGVCSAKAAAFDQGKQGCGFTAAGVSSSSTTGAGVTESNASGSTSSSTTGVGATGASASGSTSSSSASSAGSAINKNAPGAQNVGKGNGSQFITGQCFSDADCASGCCATKNGAGVCSARAVAFDQGKQGCGFTATGV